MEYRMIPVSGDRIVFLGDSITQQQLYTNYVESYLASRYPGLGLSFWNAGWGGDTAPGGVKRLARDVLALKPTLVTVCYGMNDGRYSLPKPEIAADYENGMRELLARLRAAGCRVVVLTPGVVDYDRNPTHKANDYNRGLRVLADIALRLAADAGATGYDLHRLMLDVQTRAKAADPAFTMIPDAVHPDPAGQLVMAYALLDALGVPPRTVGLEVDMAQRSVTTTGMRKAKLGRGTEAVVIHAELSELPFHVEPAAEKVLPFLPFRARFDAQVLRVTGLQGDNWQLRANSMRTPATRAQLEAGVDLSTIAGTSPAKAAAAVHAFTRDKDQMYFTAWRQLALQGGNDGTYYAAAHRGQVAASRLQDRAREKLITTKQGLRLAVTLLPSLADGDLLTDGDLIGWWHLRGPLAGGVHQDHLGGEAAFSADAHPDSTWIEANLDTANPGNNLNTLIGPAENCVAYAVTVLESPAPQTAELRIGSDDGCAVWLNGEQVHENLEVARGCTLDQDRVPVRLRAGRNHLLVKIGQYGGGWGFCVRLSGLSRPVVCKRR
jgi:lysophospholipase L1-like esterase